MLGVSMALAAFGCGSEDSPAARAVGDGGGRGGTSGNGGTGGSSAGTGGADGGALSDSGNVVKKGNRLLGMHVAEGQNEEYGAALTAALGLGVEVIDIAMPWGSLETRCNPPTYDPTFVGYFDAISAVFPTQGIKVGFVVLGPVNTNVKEVPADVASSSLDDPSLIACFNGMLDFVLPKLSSAELVSFAIGNEIDGYLGQNSARWSEFSSFFSATSAHAKSKRPGLRVGSVATLGGLLGGSRSFLLELNQKTDLVLFTDYGLEQDFTVKPSSSVASDWDELVSLYPGKKIHAQEAGHPSSAACSSSEALQAEWFSSVYATWDRHPEELELVYIAFLTDWNPATIDQTASYYGLNDPRFKGFLGSLGLRRWDTSHKLSFTRIGQESALRGF